MIAIYLPDSGSLPRWVGILVGAVVLAMAALRIYLLWRSRRRRRR
ncbi:MULTISPECIES: hypothetical protein [Streptomyces]